MYIEPWNAKQVVWGARGWDSPFGLCCIVANAGVKKFFFLFLLNYVFACVHTCWSSLCRMTASYYHHWEVSYGRSRRWQRPVLAPFHRSCNDVAHALAAIGCNSSDDAYLNWEVVPLRVENLVAGDLAVLGLIE
jgi:hypothetical protein